MLNLFLHAAPQFAQRIRFRCGLLQCVLFRKERGRFFRCGLRRAFLHVLVAHAQKTLADLHDIPAAELHLVRQRFAVDVGPVGAAQVLYGRDAARNRQQGVPFAYVGEVQPHAAVRSAADEPCAVLKRADLSCAVDECRESQHYRPPDLPAWRLRFSSSISSRILE